MSLEIDGVWAADVWASTAWADGVWHEGESVQITVAGLEYTMPDNKLEYTIDRGD